MALVVQKYGGTSVGYDRAHPRGRAAAHRGEGARRPRRRGRLGHGRCHRRARSSSPARSAPSRPSARWTCCSPPASRSRSRCSRWRSTRSGTRRSRFTGAAGGHRLGRRATPRPASSEVRADRVRGGARRGQDRHRGRLPGADRRRARSRRSVAAAPTPPPSRSRRGSAPTCARSTPTSTASSPPTRASCPTLARSTRSRYEEMLEMAATRRAGPAAALRRVRAQPRRGHPRPQRASTTAREPSSRRPTRPWNRRSSPG